LNLPNLRALCLALAVCGAGVAHAEPPAQADAPDAIDPRAALLERQHAFYITRWFTNGLFARVDIEGPYADLCRVDTHDAQGELINVRWVRFKERRWELAYDPEPQRGSGWIRHTAYLDDRGRLLALIDGDSPLYVETPYRFDWSPDGGVAQTYGIDYPTRYVEDLVSPHLVRVVGPNGHRAHEVLAFTSRAIQIWNEDPLTLQTTLTWEEDGSFHIRGDLGQSTLRVDYDEHGAFLRREETPRPGFEASDDRRLTPHFDELGRLERVVQRSPRHGDRTIRPVYGCAWPAELEYTTEDVKR
jgi:hypothetical protein